MNLLISLLSITNYSLVLCDYLNDLWFEALIKGLPHFDEYLTKEDYSNILKHNCSKHQLNYLYELCYFRDETHVNE